LAGARGCGRLKGVITRPEGAASSGLVVKTMLGFGPFKIGVVEFGSLGLDGGAMFGTVPRTIWSRLIPPDEDNRVRIATRSLLVEAGDRRFVADVGCGDKLSKKLRAVYAIENRPPREGGLDPGTVTDVVLTHMHFDHAGGLCRFCEGAPEDLEVCYPRARVILQADNYAAASRPNPRERASYLREDVAGLERARLELVRGSTEIFPGIWVHQTDGHTRGQQWLEARNGRESVAFPSDLLPTSHHLNPAYTMSFDMCAETLLREKAAFLDRAVEGGWIVVFVHDPDVPAARLKRDDRGRAVIAERVTF